MITTTKSIKIDNENDEGDFKMWIVNAPIAINNNNKIDAKQSITFLIFNYVLLIVQNQLWFLVISYLKNKNKFAVASSSGVFHSRLTGFHRPAKMNCATLCLCTCVRVCAIKVSVMHWIEKWRKKNKKNINRMWLPGKEAIRSGQDHIDKWKTFFGATNYMRANYVHVCIILAHIHICGQNICVCYRCYPIDFV